MSTEHEKYLANVPQNNVFKLQGGAEINSLRELIEALDIISDETFSHHVNKSKNDFANWIEAVIGDKEEATRLRKFTDRKKMLASLRRRIAFLDAKKVREAPLYSNASYMTAGVKDFMLGLLLGFVFGILVKFFIY